MKINNAICRCASLSVSVPQFRRSLLFAETENNKNPSKNLQRLAKVWTSRPPNFFRDCIQESVLQKLLGKPAKDTGPRKSSKKMCIVFIIME